MAIFSTEALISGYKKAIKLANDFLEASKKTNIEIQKSADNIEKFSKSLNTANAKGLQNFNTVLEKTNKLVTLKIENDKEAVKAEQDLIKTEKLLSSARILETKEKEQLQKLEQIRTKTHIQSRKERERRIALSKKELKASGKLQDEYEKESKRLRELKKEIKAITISMRRQGKSTEEVEKATEKLRKETGKLDRELRALDLSLGDSFREIGKYEEALESLKNTASGVSGALNAVGAAAVTGFAFDKLTDSVSASRKAQVELDKLQNKVKATADVIGSDLFATISDALSTSEVEAAFDVYKDATKETARISRNLKFANLNPFPNEETVKNLEKELQLSKDLALVKLAESQAANKRASERAKIEASRNDPSNAESISDTIDALDNLTDKTLESEIANNGLERSLVLLVKSQQELKAISDDDTRSFEETINAKMQLVKQDKLVAAAQEAIAENELKSQTLSIGAELLSKKKITLDQALNLTSKEANELLKEKNNLLAISSESERAFTDAFVGFQNARTESSTTALETEEKLSKLLSDKLERDLDILIDGGDKLKVINEKIIADDAISNERRQKRLDDTKRLAEDSFDAQVQTIEKFTKLRIDFNSQLSRSEKQALKEKVNASNIEALLAIKDARLLNEKIRLLGLSEIFEGRTLEVIREKIQANEDFDISQKEVNTALAKTNEINEDIIDQEAQLKILRDTSIDTQEELNDAQEKLDDERLQNRIDAIDIELKAVEKSSLEEVTLNQEKNDILIEQETRKANKRIEIEENRLEKEADLADEAKELRDAGLEAATEIAIASVTAINDAKQNAAQRELDQSLRNQEIIRAGIEAGSELGEASLAHEKKIQADREAEMQRLEQKALRLNALIALLQVWGETGDIGETLAGFATVKTVAATITDGFYKGTDSVGSNGSEVKHSNGVDGYVAKLDKGEMVFNSNESDELRRAGYDTRTSIKDLVRYSSMGVDKGGQLVNIVNDNSLVVSELQEQNRLLKELPKLMPVHNRGLNDDPTYVNEVMKKGNVKTTVKRRANGTWKR